MSFENDKFCGGINIRLVWLVWLLSHNSTSYHVRYLFKIYICCNNTEKPVILTPVAVWTCLITWRSFRDAEDVNFIMKLEWIYLVLQLHFLILWYTAIEGIWLGSILVPFKVFASSVSLPSPLACSLGINIKCIICILNLYLFL